MFADHGMPDINMIIINDYSNASLLMYNELASRVTFPVYQDTPRLRLWQQVYTGQKDDFIIFDRCGQQTYHLQLPRTILSYHFTQSALWTTYFDNPCYCRRNYQHHHGRRRHHQGHSSTRHQASSHQQMQGDDPTVEHVHSRSPRCQDLLCRILRRLQRQNRRNLNRDNFAHRHRQH